MLPYVDEHAVAVNAEPDEVWDALWSVLGRSFGGTRGSRLFARAVGVRDTEPLVGFGSPRRTGRLSSSKEPPVLPATVTFELPADG